MSARTAESVQTSPGQPDDIMLPMLDAHQKMSPPDSPSPPPPDEIHSAPVIEKVTVDYRPRLSWNFGL